MWKSTPLIVLVSSLTFFSACSAGDSLNPNHPIKDGETLVSAGRKFVLGFFGRGNSTNRYLGMWYNFSTDTVVWVANRQNPINDSSGVLKITSDGNLILVQNQTNRIVWSSNTSNVKNPSAQLLHSGNLIVKDATSNRSMKDVIVWESFNHPTDTLLPGMQLGLDLRTGTNRFLTSWRTKDDPSPGVNFYIMDPRGQHEIYVRKGNDTAYRLGPWNGLRFSGIPRMVTYELLQFTFVSNQTDVYYTFRYTSKGVISRLVIHLDGTVERLGWSDQTPSWIPYWTAPKDDCDAYAECGPNGICDNEDPALCQCLRGFTPKSPVSWRFRDFQMGCVLKVKSLCRTGEGFFVVHGVKLPDTTNSTMNKAMSLTDCGNECLRNCSCTAYSAADISSGTGTGCIMWYGDLIDTRMFAVDGQDLFLRVPASELDQHKRKGATVMIVSVILGIFVVAMCGLLIWKRKQMKKMQSGKAMTVTTTMNYYDDSTKLKDELPLFDFATIASTTNNFSIENKIGQGGFGYVYKGTMTDGQEIAVKRLSMASGQGMDAFMNEAMLIAKLQHRNLVRLLGCCIEGDERMLVYEFMQNKSLDTFIFGEERRAFLDWRKRVDIVIGIARGLLYLHQDSRFRIIHRDLKAGNVLLDEAMNPRISDFGTARLFGADQMEENTRRVIGTYGYMSPEYAMDGIFSMKSDVFSFGVVVLEIISGKKNRVFYHEEQDTNLLSLAWKLWKEGKSLELLDETLSCSRPTSEVLRCIQIGLLCVQERAIDRPAMSTVMFMLSNDSSPLPEPKRPGFCKGRTTIFRERDGSSSSGKISCTINEVTLTNVEGR